MVIPYLTLRASISSMIAFVLGSTSGSTVPYSGTVFRNALLLPMSNGSAVPCSLHSYSADPLDGKDALHVFAGITCSSSASSPSGSHDDASSFLSQTGNMISLHVISSSPAPRKPLPKSSSLLPLLLPRSASSATLSFFVTVYPGKKYLIASSERALNMLSSNGFSILYY